MAGSIGETCQAKSIAPLGKRKWRKEGTRSVGGRERGRGGKKTTRLGHIHNAPFLSPFLLVLQAGIGGATSSKLGVSPAICHIREITCRASTAEGGRQDNKLFGT